MFDDQPIHTDTRAFPATIEMLRAVGDKDWRRTLRGRLLIGPLAPHGTLVSALLPVRGGR